MKNHWFYDLINFVSSRYWTNIWFHRYWNNIWPGCECPIVPLFTSKVPLSFSGPHGFVWEKTWQSRPPDFVSHPKNISKSSIYKICVSIVCMIHCLNPNLSGKPGNNLRLVKSKPCLKCVVCFISLKWSSTTPLGGLSLAELQDDELVFNSNWSPSWRWKTEVISLVLLH